MLGRTPGSIVAIRPLKDGVIADFEMTEAMLSYFIQKIHNRAVSYAPASSSACPSASPRSRSGPSGSRPSSAGAREVYLVEEPMAAAIGAGSRSPSPPAT
jgi:rod shape-determining protein MreB and related proteins